MQIQPQRSKSPLPAAIPEVAANIITHQLKPFLEDLTKATPGNYIFGVLLE